MSSIIRSAVIFYVAEKAQDWEQQKKTPKSLVKIHNYRYFGLS